MGTERSGRVGGVLNVVGRAMGAAVAGRVSQADRIRIVDVGAAGGSQLGCGRGRRCSRVGWR